MNYEKGHLSPSGVWIAGDFRANLIIDRYDPVFADMRRSKLKHLQSVNSEDAVTWNVFRSLRQITPDAWLPNLWAGAFSTRERPTDLNTAVRLWESVSPPLGLLAEGDEGASEIDVIIEAPTWVWFIEAKYRSDISLGTTTRPDRDQVLRNIDVGSYHAGVRPFYFSLLISSASNSPKGVERIEQYKDIDSLRGRLPYRADGLKNVVAVGLLTWGILADVLAEASKAASRDDERDYAARAVAWLRTRSI
jgi:hypothetical protein